MAGLAEVIDDEEVVLTAAAIRFANEILAAKTGEVIRGHDASWTDPLGESSFWTSSLAIGKIPFNYEGTPP